MQQNPGWSDIMVYTVFLKTSH